MESLVRVPLLEIPRSSEIPRSRWRVNQPVPPDTCECNARRNPDIGLRVLRPLTYRTRRPRPLGLTSSRYGGEPGKRIERRGSSPCLEADSSRAGLLASPTPPPLGTIGWSARLEPEPLPRGARKTAVRLEEPPASPQGTNVGRATQDVTTASRPSTSTITSPGSKFGAGCSRSPRSSPERSWRR